MSPCLLSFFVDAPCGFPLASVTCVVIWACSSQCGIRVSVTRLTLTVTDSKPLSNLVISCFKNALKILFAGSYGTVYFFFVVVSYLTAIQDSSQSVE